MRRLPVVCCGSLMVMCGQFRPGIMLTTHIVGLLVQFQSDEEVLKGYKIAIRGSRLQLLQIYGVCTARAEKPCNSNWLSNFLRRGGEFNASLRAFGRHADQIARSDGQSTPAVLIGRDSAPSSR